MSASFVKDEPYLVKDRVKNLAFPELVVCSLCHGIVWIPVACQTCEKPYCLSCIKAWQIETSAPHRCPNECAQYIQRTCPPAITTILNRLQVTCRYQSYGCAETLYYNRLETHEEECGYRQMTCSGCQEKVAKKDFTIHHNTCPLVSLTCHECATVYRRQDEAKHTETICLRVQLRQLKDRLTRLETFVNSHMGIQQLNIQDSHTIEEVE